MLPSARRRQQETSAREAAGESLWSKTLDRKALVRVAEVWANVDQLVSPRDIRLSETVASILRVQVGLALGRRVDPEDLYAGQYTDEWLLDIIAAVPVAVRVIAEGAVHVVEFYTDTVNRIFDEHRIAYKFVEGELVDFESDELLKTVVEPALKLLIGDKYKGAHDAYLKALKEHDPSDAITDAGTALQETLTALGCSGNALGPLIKNAKKNGLLAAHDQTLIDGIVKFMDWASADRSETGDGHKVTDADRADAWLMIHIVGALIVRLTDGTPRGSAG